MEFAVQIDTEIERTQAGECHQTEPSGAVGSRQQAIDFVSYCMKGNQDAIRLVFDFVRALDIWDNLYDGDKPVSPDEVNELCGILLLEIHTNRFFSENAHMFMPILRASFMNWRISNAMCRGDHESRIQAHVLRYAPIDLIVMAAAIIGGEDWAVQCGPEIRRFHMADRLVDYLEEMSLKDAQEGVEK